MRVDLGMPVSSESQVDLTDGADNYRVKKAREAWNPRQAEAAALRSFFFAFFAALRSRSSRSVRAVP